MTAKQSAAERQLADYREDLRKARAWVWRLERLEAHWAEKVEKERNGS